MALYTHIKGPVKYRVVGSPTIEDGVASGFSANDYFQINSPLDTTKPFEVCSRFTYRGNSTLPQTIVGVSTSGVFTLSISTNKNIRFFCGNSNIYEFNIVNITLDTILQEGTAYLAKVIFNGISYLLYLYSEDGTLIESKSANNSNFINDGNPIYLKIGNGHSTNWYFAGSIDLNHTYITVNGQPWFGSCPVRAKFRKDKNTTYTLHDPDYLVRDGKLVWANPKLWLNNDNNSSAFIETNIPGSYFQGKTVISHFAFLRTIDNNPFGLLDTSNGSRLETGIGWTASAYSANYGNVGIKCVNTTELNKKVELKFTPTSGTINSLSVFDGETYAGNISDWGVFSQNTTRTCYLLASNRQAGFRAFGGKLYDFIILDGNIELYHFVPVPAGLKIGDYTVPANGMWDMVNQKYYGNAGSGEFKIGKDI